MAVKTKPLLVQMADLLEQVVVERDAWRQLATEYKEACRTASHYTEKMHRADERFEELSKP